MALKGFKTGQDQISDLRPIITHFTGHNQDGKGIIQESRPATWSIYDDNKMAFNVAYTTSQMPVDLVDDADIKRHNEVVNPNREPPLGLVNKNGTVCRVVDFSPGYVSLMHRTVSLDYGVVLEGEIELLLDAEDQAPQRMGRGDVAVQRGTMHAWKNPSKTEWARMLFVLQDSKELKVNGQILKEDLGPGVEGLPPSGNEA